MYNSNPLRLDFLYMDTQKPEITLDPLHLNLDDIRLADTIDQRIAAYNTFYTEKKLDERQDKIVDYLKGNQYEIGTNGKPKYVDEYSIPYMENILFEAQMRNKPIALSRLPDLKADPGNDTPESKKNAELITDLINSDIKKIENRQVLGLAYNQRPQYLFSVMKAVWNPELGEQGDYQFVNIHPKHVAFDNSVPNPNVDEMEFFGEDRELSVKKIIMTFPDKKDEFLEYINFTDPNSKGTTDEKMATKYTIWEVWFHWYEEEADPDTLETKWVRIDGVVWKYKKFILGKMKNPYWDWTGKKKYFTLKPTEDKEITEDDIFKKFFGEEQQFDTVFKNYFQQPRKPYFLMTYFRSGEDPVDYTSEFEQVLVFQDSINAEGRQIFDMNSRTKGKFLFAAQKIDKTTISKLNLHDYNEAITIDTDNIGQAATLLRGDAAPMQLYKSKQDNRSIAFEMMALNATTRGTRETGDETLGARQMMREQDFGVIDDMVEETINPASKWMADWVMHFIKLFYTQPHMKRLLGKDGETVYASITQDLIEDGFEMTVSASGVDKLKRERKAIEDAQMKMIDPLSYFEAMNEPNARERARRLMLFQMAPQLYYTTIVEEQQMPPAPTPGVVPTQANPQQPPMQQLPVA